MPDPVLSQANVEALREIAESVNNLNHLVPDKRDTMGVPPDVVDAMNELGDRYAQNGWESGGDEQVRVMLAWCDLLPQLGLVPETCSEDTVDWHWSGVRCILAGAGFGAHAALAAHIGMMYGNCPLLPNETQPEWEKALKEAHEKSGIPVSLTHLPWTKLRGLPEVDATALPTMGTKWLTAAALLHILKHTRTYHDEVRVYYNSNAHYFRRTRESNTLGGNPRLLASLLDSLRMTRRDKRETRPALAEVGASAAAHLITFDRLLSCAPLSMLPGAILAGQFTKLLPAPSNEGWFQHGMTLRNAWSAGNGKVRGFTGTDETILGYGWRLEAPDDSERASFETLVACIPATYDIDTPFSVLVEYQPNFVFDWCGDVDAYACIVDSVLLMSLMRDRVLGARSEFPLVWVLPNDPTPQAATNQGKTSAVTALAGCMTPGIRISRPADTASAPDLRVVAGMIRAYGTVALDEWTMPRTQSHPLASRNLQTMATGNAVSMGEVLENNPSPVMLRQPIVASAKCLILPEDIKNRSVYLFQRGLTPEERQNVNHHEAIISGEVAIRMRLAGLDMIQKHDLAAIAPLACEGFRFKFHLGLAVRLYELRSGKPAPVALDAVTATALRMHEHFAQQFASADDSGIVAEMESGESISIRASTMFGSASPMELLKIQDLAKDLNDKERMSPTALMRFRLMVSADGGSQRDALRDLLGWQPRAPNRALAQSLASDLHRLMPKEGAEWLLPDMLGIGGWRLVRAADQANGKGTRFKLVQIMPK